MMLAACSPSDYHARDIVRSDMSDRSSRIQPPLTLIADTTSMSLEDERIESLSHEPEPLIVSHRIAHVSLRVRDLEESAGFYCSVFELERHETTPTSARRCRCEEAGRPGAAGRFAVEMTEGGPILSGAGMDHFGLEVDTAEQVALACQRAREAGVRTTALRQAGGRWYAYVFDPDGHKVQVFSRTHDQSVQKSEVCA